MMIKNLGLVAGKTILQLLKVGSFATAGQYMNQEMRNNANHLIGDVERGAKHAGHKLKLIKD